MPNNTSGRGPRRTEPVLIAVGAIAVLLVVMFLLPIALLLVQAGQTMASVVFLVLYILLGMILMAGVIAALVQRLREIKRGEEEDARKY